MQDKETLKLNKLEADSKRKNTIYRWILYSILGIFIILLFNTIICDDCNIIQNNA